VRWSFGTATGLLLEPGRGDGAVVEPELTDLLQRRRRSAPQKVRLKATPLARALLGKRYQSRPTEAPINLANLTLSPHHRGACYRERCALARTFSTAAFSLKSSGCLSFAPTCRHPKSASGRVCSKASRREAPAYRRVAGSDAVGHALPSVHAAAAVAHHTSSVQYRESVWLC
jgi:hypothetical protein